MSVLALAAVLVLPLVAALAASPRAAGVGVEPPDLRAALAGVQRGDRVEYALSIENVGGLPAVDIRMATTLPAGLLLDASNVREWHAALPDLAAGGTAHVGFAARIGPSSPGVVEVVVTIAYRAPGGTQDYLTSARSGVSLTSGPAGSPLLLALAAVLGVLFAVGYGWRVRSQTVRIDQLFLVHDSGMLIRHYTNGSGLQRDEDIVGGMLIVVQEFVRDSVKDPHSPLEEVRFGDRRILLVRGRHCTIAAVVAGRRLNGLPARLARAVSRFERAHGAELADWNGDLGDLTAAERAFEGLLVPRYTGRGPA